MIRNTTTRKRTVGSLLVGAALVASGRVAMADGTSRQSPIDIKTKQTVYTNKAPKIALNLSSSADLDINNT